MSEEELTDDSIEELIESESDELEEATAEDVVFTAEDGTSVRISAADGSNLPEGVTASVAKLDREQSVEAVKAYVGAEDPADTEPEYQVFDIALEGVDTAAFPEGFNVELTFPEAVNGNGFELYLIRNGVAEPLEAEPDGTQNEDGTESAGGIRFTTDAFGDFVIKYTVEYRTF